MSVNLLLNPNPETVYCNALVYNYLVPPINGLNIIEAVTVTSGNVDNVVFANIPNTYNHLKLKIYGSQVNALVGEVNMTFNGYVDNNYNYCVNFYNNTGVAVPAVGTPNVASGNVSFVTSSAPQGNIILGPLTNGLLVPGYLEVDIPFYVGNTFNKSVFVNGGYCYNNVSNRGTISIGSYTNSVAPISNLTVNIPGNLISGSYVYLYGQL